MICDPQATLPNQYDWLWCQRPREVGLKRSFREMRRPFAPGGVYASLPNRGDGHTSAKNGEVRQFRRAGFPARHFRFSTTKRSERNKGGLGGLSHLIKPTITKKWLCLTSLGASESYEVVDSFESNPRCQFHGSLNNHDSHRRRIVIERVERQSPGSFRF